MTTKILKFQASWCNPCQSLSNKMRGVDLGLPVEEVDIDHNVDFAASYAIRSVPTLVMVREGSMIAKLIGPKSVDEIRQWVDNHR